MQLLVGRRLIQVGGNASLIREEARELAMQASETYLGKGRDKTR